MSSAPEMMDTATTDSAAAKALAVPELLERILCAPGIDPRDLCAVQRTSRHFNAFMTSSSKVNTTARLPANKVLGNRELLEKILIELVNIPELKDDAEPVDDPRMSLDERFKVLYVLQRVNRTFRDTIVASTALQRCMWKSPDHVHDLRPWVNVGNRSDYNPLLCSVLFAPFLITNIRWEV